MYADVERYETSNRLSDRHKAALRYADALIWKPSRIDSEVAAGVRDHFTEEEAFELTLDVMRNACNKIMVALGADAPRVSEGMELFLIDAAPPVAFSHTPSMALCPPSWPGTDPDTIGWTANPAGATPPQLPHSPSKLAREGGIRNFVPNFGIEDRGDGGGVVGLASKPERLGTLCR